jgi:outer membrane protein TolC
MKGRSTVLLFAQLAACVSRPSEPPPPAAGELAPPNQPAAAAVALDSSAVQPMYTELLAIDLPAVLRLCRDRNLDIRLARTRVEASHGQVDAAIGQAVPVLAFGALFEQQWGSARAVQGTVVPAQFLSFSPAALLGLVLNPGRVVYDILAARQALFATEQQEHDVVQQTVQTALRAWYDLALAQLRVAAAREAVADGEEALRIAQLRQDTGTGVPAAVLKAEGSLAGQRRELVLAVRDFYSASIALAGPLRLDPRTTLVPAAAAIEPVRLIDEALAIDRLLELAVLHRPDLRALRLLAEAAGAHSSAAMWNLLGPQVLAGASVGGIDTRVAGQDSGLKDQERVFAGAGWTISMAQVAQRRTATAQESQALLEVEARLEVIRAQVVRAAQDVRATESVIPLAAEQLASAVEGVRLAQLGQGSGTATDLDVLNAGEAAAQARLRHAESVIRYDQAQVVLVAALGLVDQVPEQAFTR